MKNKKGFTLVELLVSMAIIGMLIMLVYAAVGVARRAARDTARKTDLQAIELLLEEAYGGADVVYPTGGCGTENGLCMVTLTTNACVHNQSAGNTCDENDPTVVLTYDISEVIYTNADTCVCTFAVANSGRDEIRVEYARANSGQAYELCTLLETGNCYRLGPE